MYLKIKNGNIIYPYSIQDLRIENSNVSFPKNLTDEVLEPFDVYKVQSNPSQYENDPTKDVEEKEPILSGSVYIQDWVVTDADQTTIDKREEIKWDEIREERDKLLTESDWTQLPDSPLSSSKKTEWQTYRQELRDITTQPNPFQITWPDIPT